MYDLPNNVRVVPVFPLCIFFSGRLTNQPAKTKIYKRIQEIYFFCIGYHTIEKEKMIIKKICMNNNDFRK